jgi:TPR repeat protein
MFESGPWRRRPHQGWHPGLPIGIVSVLLIGTILVLAATMLQWPGSMFAQTDKLTQAVSAFRNGDDRQAVDLFSQLASGNNGTAQYWLAHMTELGLGVPRNPPRALSLYQKAAAQNVTAASLRLGEIYLHGELVPPDFAQARSYLESAAYSGDARAAMLLADIYRHGLGTAADPKNAYAWSEVAAIEGNADARRARDALLYALDLDGQKAAVARAEEILETIRRGTLASSAGDSGGEVSTTKADAPASANRSASG